MVNIYVKLTTGRESKLNISSSDFVETPINMLQSPSTEHIDDACLKFVR